MPKPQHAAMAKSLGRPAIRLTVVLAISIVGYLAGVFSGPYLLEDLDLDVYELSSRQRIHGWAFLCVLGFGLAAATRELVLADRRRVSESTPLRRFFGGLRTALVWVAIGALPALVTCSLVFGGPRASFVRANCTYNLKAIALAMDYYHAKFGCLPPAYLADEQGRPKHSWRVLILPYLEMTGFGNTEGLKQIYESYDFAEPWDGPNNRKLAHRMPMVYGCLDDRGRRLSTTAYVVITGNHSPFPGNRTTKFEQIRDGRATTILAVEASKTEIDWMEPRDYPIQDLRFSSPERPGGGIGGNHLGGANAAFVDGSVRFLKAADINKKTLDALATMDGGEKIDRSEF